MFFGMNNNGFGGCGNKGGQVKDGGCDCCTLLLLILLLGNCGCGNGFGGEDTCGCIWSIILIMLLLNCFCK